MCCTYCVKAFSHSAYLMDFVGQPFGSDHEPCLSAVSIGLDLHQILKEWRNRRIAFRSHTNPIIRPPLFEKEDFPDL